MIKYSVIGTSWITKAFISGANLVEELSLLGVYSRTYEKGREFANQTGAKEVYTSLDELACSDSDFVYVASPNACHFEQCKFLLEHKKSVICEKPVTITADEFSELFSLAEKNGVVYFEAIMYMHNPVRKLLKDAVSRIGIISSANIDYSQLSSKYAALKRGELPNIFNPEMKTGALNDLGIYCVYPVVDLLGIPEVINPTQKFLHTGADGSGAASFLYGDKLVNITYSKTGQSRSYSEILGDEGTVTVESISQLTNIDRYENDGTKITVFGDTTKDILMANEARSMVNFLTEKEKYRDFYIECAEMSKKVLMCMEKMRTENR